MAKKWQHRKCERCRAEYLPTARSSELLQPRVQTPGCIRSGAFSERYPGPKKAAPRSFRKKAHRSFKISDGLTCTGFTGRTA